MKDSKLVTTLLVGLPVIVLLAVLLLNSHLGKSDSGGPEEGAIVSQVLYEVENEPLGIDISIESTELTSINNWVEQELTRIEREYRELVEGGDFGRAIQYPMLNAELGTYEWDGRMSAVLSVYEYAGGAHGYPYVLTAVADIESDTIVGLSDVIGSEDYLRPLSRLMLGKVSDLHEVFDGDTIRDSLAPSATNYEHWSIGPDGITFYFNPYVIAPYAAGIIDVLVTWDEVEDLV